MGEFMDKMLHLGKRILKAINDSGYEAYFVGGYVRDQVLNIPSSDIDITTNAHPEVIETIFEKTIPTGKKYGTMTVRLQGQSFEVTTYRMDQNYQNHRQPESVIFSNTLEDDLVRRDFTMNAIAQDINGERIDLFGGIGDISNRVIRAIDDPNKRFKEDALRILRAIRFVGKLDFEIEENTMNAMKKDAHLLGQIPIERIGKELTMIFKQDHIQKVYQTLDDIHFGDVFPDFDQAIHLLKKTHNHHSLEAIFALGIYPQMRFDSKLWRLSNKQAGIIEDILKIMSQLDHQIFNPCLAFQHDKDLVLIADDLLSRYFKLDSQKQKINEVYQELRLDSIKDLAISGQMIEPMVKKKRDIGIIIDDLVEAVLYKRIENTQQALLNYAQNLAEVLNETE